MKIPIPSFLNEVAPYTTSKPTMKGGKHQGSRVRLAANENPIGASPKAADAIKNYLSHVHRYPDPGADDLRHALAVRLDLNSDNIICGNGSDEIMDLAVRTFMRPGEEGIFPWPSFVVYKILVQFAGGIPVGVPLKNYQTDVKAIINRVTERTRVIFLGCPNNPTGLVLEAGDLSYLLENVPPSVMVVLDEAYVQFVRRDNYRDATKLIAKHANLLVLRTFSKYFGLAGLRAGFGFADPELIEVLNRVRMPFNLNVLAQIGALASLWDVQHLERTKILVHRGLDFLYQELDRLQISYLKSDANFILIDVKQDAHELAERMYEEGVEIRPMTDYGLTNHIRVSVGLERENQIFIETLSKALGR